MSLIYVVRITKWHNFMWNFQKVPIGTSQHSVPPFLSPAPALICRKLMGLWPRTRNVSPCQCLELYTVVPNLYYLNACDTVVPGSYIKEEIKLRWSKRWVMITHLDGTCISDVVRSSTSKSEPLASWLQSQSLKSKSVGFWVRGPALKGKCTRHCS